jgi:hypothetical protein
MYVGGSCSHQILVGGVGHVALIGEMENACKVILVGKTEGKRPFEDLGIGGRIILE